MHVSLQLNWLLLLKATYNASSGIRLDGVTCRQVKEVQLTRCHRLPVKLVSADLSCTQLVSLSTPPPVITDKHTNTQWCHQASWLWWMDRWGDPVTESAIACMKQPGADSEISLYLWMMDNMTGWQNQTWSHEWVVIYKEWRGEHPMAQWDIHESWRNWKL